MTGLQLAPGLVDSLAMQIKAVHGGQDPDAPGRLLEPFVVARRVFPGSAIRGPKSRGTLTTPAAPMRTSRTQHSQLRLQCRDCTAQGRRSSPLVDQSHGHAVRATSLGRAM